MPGNWVYYRPSTGETFSYGCPLKPFVVRCYQLVLQESPEMPKAAMPAKATTQSKYKQELAIRKRFAEGLLVGADPEFVILKEGKAVKQPPLMVHHSVRFGTDHNGWVQELRPSPSKSVLEMRNKIARLMTTEYAKGIESFGWRAGAYHLRGRADGDTVGYITTGGHLHFGQTPEQEEKVAWLLRERATTYSNTLNALVVALEHLDILPQMASKNRREIGGYGKLEYDNIRWDGSRHFEYRPMPSWLYHPDTAMLCATLAKLVVVHPKTMGKILAESVTNPGPAIEGIVRKFAKDLDAAWVLEKLPVGNFSKLVHDPDVEIREAWREVIPEAVAEWKGRTSPGRPVTGPLAEF